MNKTSADGVVEFHRRRHEYREAATGRSLTSVTRVLREAGTDDRIGWLEQFKPDVLEFARFRGSQTHDAIEKFHADGDPVEIANTIDVCAVDRFRSYLEFLSDLGDRFELVASEPIVYDLGLGVAGQVDVVGMIDGIETIVEVKTSSRIYDSARIQAAAYARMQGAAAAQVLHLRDNGYKVHEVDVEEWWPYFAASLAVIKAKERARVKAGGELIDKLAKETTTW